MMLKYLYQVILNFMTIQLPDNLELDNVFWRFSLSLWQQKTAQETLLRLQNAQNLRVNFLLLSMWLGLEKKTIAGHFDFMVQQTDSWHQQVVSPLRLIRKTIPKKAPNPALRPQVQNSELMAEQVEQALLFNCATKLPKVSDKQASNNTLYILTRNLLDYATYHQQSSQENKGSKLTQADLLLLIQACLPTHPSSHISACIETLTSSKKV